MYLDINENRVFIHENVKTLSDYQDVAKRVVEEHRRLEQLELTDYDHSENLRSASCDKGGLVLTVHRASGIKLFCMTEPLPKVKETTTIILFARDY